jgi:hypothetical protein
MELNNTTTSFKSPEDSQKALQSPDKDPNNDLLLLDSELKVSNKLLCFQSEPQNRESLEATLSKKKLSKNLTCGKPKGSKNLD